MECDLKFPVEIHDKLKEFPPCPENITPNTKWMSDYQINLLRSKEKIRLPGMKRLKKDVDKHMLE